MSVGSAMRATFQGTDDLYGASQPHLFVVPKPNFSAGVIDTLQESPVVYRFLVTRSSPECLFPVSPVMSVAHVWLTVRYGTVLHDPIVFSVMVAQLDIARVSAVTVSKGVSTGMKECSH